MRKVEDFKINKGASIDDLVRQMEASGGFTSKNLGVATGILETMINEKGCFNFLSFPADIIATGARGVIKELVKRKWFDAVITTCGTLDHDIARNFADYYHGDFFMDDSKLRKSGINRLGNVLVPNASYGMTIENKMQAILNKIYKKKKEFSTHELCWEIGKRLGKDSILYWAEKNRIPVIVPGITDGAVGYQIWSFSQDHDFKINILADEKLLSDIVWKNKKTGALVIGGGISKHHVIWWAQFAKGLDYAVYMTTAQEYDGSLSGARTHEAVSWGKIKEKARHVTVYGDATVTLPVIFAALIERT